MASVTVDRVGKSYGKHEVFRDLEIEIADGEFVALLGPSGCGKSTLLRCIAGLEDLSGGDVRFGDRSVVDVAPAKRGAAMVFQTYALYPHKTVAQNMGFALKIADTPQAEIDIKVAEAAEILNIGSLLSKRPRELSGGQRQRVAIGRAIVREPDVFLFDEPLSNLDAELRARMRLELSRLHGRLGTTMIYVTHDQVEAMTMADRIVILEAGAIRQIGTPQEVFDRPANLFVAQFIGAPSMNLLEAGRYPEIAEHLAKRSGGVAVQTIGIRPDDLDPNGKGNVGINMQIDVAESLGRQRLYHGRTITGDEVTLSSHKAPIDISKITHASVDLKAIHAFAADGARIDLTA